MEVCDFPSNSVEKSSEIETESEALRDHRARAQWDNWLKDLRTELYQILYETPIYPKNLYLERAPMNYGRILALPDHSSPERIECGSLPTLKA